MSFLARDEGAVHPVSLHALQELHRRARLALDALEKAQHNFTAERCRRTHGALSLAVAQAQHVLRVLERARAALQGVTVSTTNTNTSRSSTDGRGESREKTMQRSVAQLRLELEQCRVKLRRALPAAAAVLDAAQGEDCTAGSEGSSAADALRSLLRTRSLLSVELKKVDTAVQELTSSSETLGLLHSALQDVHATVEVAQAMVRKLLTVESRDDLLLRLSLLCFAAVVGYIVAQRVFGFFPAIRYVTLPPSQRVNVTSVA